MPDRKPFRPDCRSTARIALFVLATTVAAQTATAEVLTIRQFNAKAVAGDAADAHQLVDRQSHSLTSGGEGYHGDRSGCANGSAQQVRRRSNFFAVFVATGYEGVWVDRAVAVNTEV